MRHSPQVSNPTEGTKEDIFEQLVRFSFSEEFLLIREYIRQIPLIGSLRNLQKAAYMIEIKTNDLAVLSKKEKDLKIIKNGVS